MKQDLRDKVLCIILTIFSVIYPLTLFFDVFEFRHKAFDGEKTKNVVDKYNLINIKDMSTYIFVISLIFIVLSLSVAVFLILEIKKKSYYSLKLRILFSSLTVISGGFSICVGFYLVSVLFMIIASHMFMVYYDIKRNKHKLSNALIYSITYTLFLFMLVFSYGFMPMF